MNLKALAAIRLAAIRLVAVGAGAVGVGAVGVTVMGVGSSPSASVTYRTSQATATAPDVRAGSRVSVSVTGFGGMRGPNASAAPTASGAPVSATVTATDVTITSK